MNQLKLTFFLAAAVTALCVVSTQAATFTPLGFLPGGGSYSEARDISGDGNVVVGTSRNGANVNEAFRWTNTTGMQGLGDLPGGQFQSDALGVSTTGNVIV